MKESINYRTKQLFINSGFTILVKGGALLVSFITFPYYIAYFENQAVMGFWFTALSVLSWILTFDLGIGNGLRNKLVIAFEKKNLVQAKVYISSAYTIAGILVLVLSIIGFFVISTINWNRVFNTSSTLISTNLLNEVVTFVFIGIMLQFFLRLANSIYFAIQKPVIPGLLNLISSVLILFFLTFSDFNSLEEKLKALAIAVIFINNMPVLFATLILFQKNLRQCLPNILFTKKKESISIIKLGAMFFGLQIVFLFISNTKEFFISWLSQPADVVEFQIYNKPFSFISSFFFIALTPVWSAVTLAYSKHDFHWIKELISRLRKLSSLAIFSSLLMVFFLQIFVNLWLGERSIKINLLYGFLFSISTGAFIWSAVVSSIANGMGKLKTQAMFMGFGAIINFPLAYIFVGLLESWIGVIVSNILSLLPYCIAQTLTLRKSFKGLV